MKKSVILLFVSFLILSCKNDKKGGADDTEATLIRGEFILINDAGVIKGEDFIYGVVLNEKAHELNEKIKPMQREEYDMVPVVINGKIKDNTEEGWPEVVEITEILGVNTPTSELPTKINASGGEEEGEVLLEEENEEDHEGHDHE
ncbi:hypothetical protein NBT05_04875 [Aquimarina sp. ERC-38]|uniref:hypothetical protein n=1 Tax=Aquimarina sp. ERC-38 TaxID=2949996 RepID=UPI0022450EAE|nr:hypothetical protein [Aquimarina sp. ERC-38]UZO81801.1 hypothetical protein NBT05_04875 [Aquimarina sp. ERC-38]